MSTGITCGRRAHESESESVVLVRLPASDSRNRPPDSPVRLVASVTLCRPRRYEAALSVVKPVLYRGCTMSPIRIRFR